MINVSETRFPSSDGSHQLYCRIYEPEGGAKGLLHVVHGMIEHIGRYDRFMRELAAQGWVCYGFDNLGHGRTARDGSELGYMGGFRYLLADTRRFTAAMKKRYDEPLPCVLMGHSMGSFIVRCTFTDRLWDRLIIMGTAGANPAAPAAIAMLGSLIRVKGKRAHSPAIERLMFGTYNTHFDEDDAHAWLSTMQETRDLYHADRFCTFHFCLDSMKDMLEMLVRCNRTAWFEGMPDVPILLLAGTEDPVGNYGKGVRQICERLKKNGKNVRMRLYEGYRHEILNDVCYDEVTEEILRFLS